MKQVVIKNGVVSTELFSKPSIQKGQVLIKVEFSAISGGTENQTVKDSKFSLIDKIKKNPKKVFTYFKSFNTLGIKKSLEIVEKLKTNSVKTGYSISGTVVGLGEGVNNFDLGDKVVGAGAGYANHAEFVSVPKNLVAKLPNQVGFKEGCTATICAISLNSIRRSKLSGGEFAVVYGVGILGLITVQILKAYGIRVAAIDVNSTNLILAKKLGAEIIVNASNESDESITNWTGGKGVDAVIFAANTSQSSPLKKAFKLLRKNGDLILLGKADLQIDRNDIYRKQLNLITSTSYGPGRYDANYEEDGIDYPHEYVRWTENKNLSEVLRLMSNGSLVMDDLITATYRIQDSEKAFLATSQGNHKIICFEYDNINSIEKESDNSRSPTRSFFKNKPIKIGVIGASPFFKQVHYPNLLTLKDQFILNTIVSRDPINAKQTAKEMKFSNYGTDPNMIFHDPEIDLVFITSSQDTHGEFVKQSILNNKAVFVEKPLGVTFQEIKEIQEITPHDYPLMVGFNRRFSTHTQKIFERVKERSRPLFITYEMNIAEKNIETPLFKQGGRVIGEACHIIDLFEFLTNSKLQHFYFEKYGKSPEKHPDDNVSITLKYEDGSICVLNYRSIGSDLLPKESMSIHWEGNTIEMSNYEFSTLYNSESKEIIYDKFDKGHKEELSHLYKCLSTGIAPSDLDSLINTSLLTIKINNEESY